MRTEFLSQPDYTTVVSLADAKLQMRIPSGITTEDDLHTAYIAVAGETVMEQTGVVPASCSVRLWIDDDIDSEWLPLPYTPLTITEVAFKNADGTYTSSTDYEYATGKTPRIRFTSLPSGTGFGRVRITATAGHGSGACPRSLVHAIKLLVAHYDENRSETTIPAEARPIPKGVDALLSPYRNIYFTS